MMREKISPNCKAGLKMLSLAVIIALTALPVVAQERTITLPAGTLKAGDVFDNILRQTPYQIAVNNDRVADLTVTLASTNVTVKHALDRLLAGSGMNYRMEDDYILIRTEDGAEPQKPAPQAAPPARGTDKYVPTPLSRHDNVNRLRPEPVAEAVPVAVEPVEAVEPEPLPEPDYTSYIAPMDSYMTVPQSRYALKTNLLHGLGTLTPNLGVEFGLGERTTLELHGAINPWRLKSRIGDNKKLAHLFVRPEFRYWFCERFNGHFVGVHAMFTHFNVGSYDIPLLFKKEYRYQGIGYGGGVSYGYFLPFGTRWGMEFNIGAGVLHFNYDRFDCEGCSRGSEKKSKTYVGPTRLGITLVFNIK